MGDGCSTHSAILSGMNLDVIMTLTPKNNYCLMCLSLNCVLSPDALDILITKFELDKYDLLSSDTVNVQVGVDIILMGNIGIPARIAPEKNYNITFNLVNSVKNPSTGRAY